MARNYRRVEETRDTAGYAAWDCDHCGKEVRRYRGSANADCSNCGSCYNASGQRLRADWRGNPSNHDDSISDLDGFEIQHSRQ